MHPLKSIFRFRSSLFLTGLLALWGSAVAQIPTQGIAATNSSPAAVIPPILVSVTNQPPQVPPADSSIDSLRQKAKAGDAKSQLALGEAFNSGHGVTEDPVEAAKWYRKAADQGDAKAQYNLGLCYQDGYGVEKNAVEAAKWYRKAAEQGDAPAQTNLGKCYRYGYGVEKDAVEAVKWSRKAAEQGDMLAQYNLGVDYDKGYGVTQDYAQALSWYRKAADQGVAEAQNNLGLMYEKGRGVTQDYAQAVTWYLKAADHGSADAQVNLGVMYSYGRGVSQDFTEALSRFRKAALQGNVIAEFNLGLMNLMGEGVPQDYSEALAWFIVASSAGDKEAAAKRNKLEAALGVQATMLAQERSREIFRDIEQSQVNPSRLKDASPYQMDSGQPQSSGTGVFVSQDGLLITAAHVIKNAHAIKIVTRQGLRPAHVIKIDSSNDVALLKCEGQFQAVPIKSSGGVKLGQPVFTVGFPDTQLQGFSPKMTQGEISSLSGIQDDPRDWQISVPVRPGNSGGPLFDAQGNVIGLVVGKLDALITAQATGALPENINYAVKTAYILPLLDSYASDLLPVTSTPEAPEKTENVVGRVQNSVVLIMVY